MREEERNNIHGFHELTLATNLLEVKEKKNKILTNFCDIFNMSHFQHVTKSLFLNLCVSQSSSSTFFVTVQIQKQGNWICETFPLLCVLGIPFYYVTCDQGSISPMFYAQLLRTYVARAALLCLHFRLYFTGARLLAQKLRKEHWWNWPQVISPSLIE